MFSVSGGWGRPEGKKAMEPTRKKPDRFQEHPAYIAWTGFAGCTEAIRGIDVLKEDDRSSVYRLVTADPRGPNIIVKSSSRDRIVKESTAYERILPLVSVVVPRYRGFVDGREHENSYLFVDEVGGRDYSSAIGEHRLIAGEWLGHFHVSSAELIAKARYFERDLQYYQGHLRLAAETILKHRSNPSLKEDDLQVLDAITSQCDLMERHWGELEDYCSRMPLCYSHGDFKSDNVRIVHTSSGHRHLVVFDWSAIALHIPAVDATQLFALSFSKEPINADIHAYCAIVRRKWPFMDVPQVRRLAYVGEIFRWVVAIRWAAEDLKYEWTEQAIYLFRLYRSWMEDIVHVAPWEKTCVARDRLGRIAASSIGVGSRAPR